MATKKTKRATPRKAKHQTREAWLLAACQAVRSLFDDQGADPYPALRVSCGWPKGGRKAIGQAWSGGASSDGTVELFISPELADPVRVLDALVHELCHAIVGNEHGHRGPFAKLARSVGLTGKLTATEAGEELADHLRHLLGKLGPYPHAELRAGLKLKKQTTRMLLCECKRCGCKVRMTRKWLDKAGPPLCGCGSGALRSAC